MYYMLYDFVKEISQTQADLIKSFAIFYLLLVGNYIGSSIFTCVQIKYIQHLEYNLKLYM